jgi:hypothetical protein
LIIDAHLRVSSSGEDKHQTLSKMSNIILRKLKQVKGVAKLTEDLQNIESGKYFFKKNVKSL